ncbi:MADF domain-containing protein [Caerostris extrusa]|uniref:MADF domain-containing protein n=2 Tax=Caerostris extrusa TaxID=172846 RepID=A0AAV4R3W8_CAEEX|nr:MADF domain-containing protein [Caerostris extrusa]
MEFLIPFMQSKNQDLSLDVDKTSASENSDTAQNCEDKKHNIVAAMEEDANDSSSSFYRKKRKTIDDLKEENKELSRSSISPGNALLDFFSSMYNTTEELPPQLQLQVKRKIFDVISEAEETALLMMQQQTQEYDAQYFWRDHQYQELYLFLQQMYIPRRNHYLYVCI